MEEIKERATVNSYLERVAEQGEIIEKNLNLDQKIDYKIWKNLGLEDKLLSGLKNSSLPLNLVKQEVVRIIKTLMDRSYVDRARIYYDTFKEIIEYEGKDEEKE